MEVIEVGIGLQVGLQFCDERHILCADLDFLEVAIII